jgi:hypothetical protein
VLLPLPNELVKKVIDFIDTTHLMKVAVVCKQLIPFAKDRHKYEIEDHKIKLSRVLEEWKNTISYKIDDDTSYFTYTRLKDKFDKFRKTIDDNDPEIKESLGFVVFVTRYY